MTQDRKSKSADSHIDENLRRVFNETLEEDIPDRFKELLDKLRARDSADPQDSGENENQ